jgi:glycosyltransferase involved in cell wall biosynthesis
MTDGRIAVLELRSVRGTGGGPEKTILVGAARADRSRFDVTVCYIRDLRDGIFGIDTRAGSLPIDYVEVRERHSLDPAIWPALRRLVRDRHIDIVHSHEYKTDLLAWLLARRDGVIALATAHGWTGQSARERWLYYPANKRLLTRFPRVIAVSTDIQQQLVRRGASADRVSVVLNGIDPAAFHRDPSRQTALRAAHGWTTGDVVIGAVGRLERQKRFDLLLDVFARVAPSHPALRLALVGDGRLRTELEAQTARLALGDRVRFLGHRSDLVDLHHTFDLLVQSSEYEGTPNAVLEAMAMETPIVATDAGGTRELAWPDVHALVVPVGDANALASAVSGVLAHPAAARTRAIAARRRIETDLSFEARTRTLEALYEELMRERDERLTGRADSRAAAVKRRVPHA